MKNLIRFLALTALSYFLLPAQLAAQSVGPIPITSAQCATIATADVQSTVGIYVSGTWTGTLQPKGTIQGQTAFNVQATPSTSFTPQSTITANGGYTVAVAGYSTFTLCGATVATGEADIWLNVSEALSIAASGAVASGVTSFTGDGALLSNSASTGAVTATLANAASHTVFGNNTSSSAAPGYQAWSTITPGGLALPFAGATAPSPVLTSECPASNAASFWVQDNAGNYHTQGGVESLGVATPNGVFEECRQHWINDSLGAPPHGQNSLFAVYHIAGTRVNIGSFDDRAMFVATDTLSSGQTFGNSLYGIYAEVQMQGANTYSGSLARQAAVRGAIGDDRTSGSITRTTIGVDGAYVRTTAGTSYNTATCNITNPCMIGTDGTAGTTPGGFAAGDVLAGVVGFAYQNNTSGNTEGIGAAFVARVPSGGLTAVLPKGNYGYYSNAFSATAGDWNFISAGSATTGNNGFQGLSYFGNGLVVATTRPAAVLDCGEYAGVPCLIVRGSTSGAITFKAQAAAGTYEWDWPVSAGTSGQLLTSSGGAGAAMGWTTGGVIIGLTANKIPKANSATSLADSSISDDGTTVSTAEIFSAAKYATATNCAASGTAANPSVASCTAAAAGAVACDIAASGGTCTVNTTAVTANSEIFVQLVQDEGTRLGVTCNTTPSVLPSIFLRAKVAATSFTFNVPTGLTNPFCFDYHIVN